MQKSDFIKKIEEFSEDSDQAFTELVNIIDEIDFNDTGADFDNFVLKFILRFSTRFKIPIPQRSQQDSTFKYLGKIIVQTRVNEEKKETDEIITKYEDRSLESEFGFAVLTDDEKKTILDKLQEIKNIIVASNINEKKKIALIKRISSLEIEVNSNKTSTDRFFRFLTDLAFVAGEMANNAQPAIDEFKDILRIVMRSRAKNEGLPSPDQWSQLPGPEDFG